MAALTEATWNQLLAEWKQIQVNQSSAKLWSNIRRTLQSCCSFLLSLPPATGVQETYSELRQRQDEVRKLENSCSSSAAKHKKNMDSILSTLAKQ